MMKELYIFGNGLIYIFKQDKIFGGKILETKHKAKKKSAVVGLRRLRPARWHLTFLLLL